MTPESVPAAPPASSVGIGERLDSAAAPARRRGWLDGFFAAAVCVLAYFLALTPAHNSDLWLHLASGRALVQGRATLGVDPFASTTAGLLWVNHSWLSDAAFYALYQIDNGKTLIVAKAILLAALAVLFFSFRRRGAPMGAPALAALCATAALGPRQAQSDGRARPALLATACAITALGPWLLLQPALLSVFGLALTLFLLERPSLVEESRAGHAGALRWLLPPLFALWANLDAWFVLGPALVGLYAVGELLRRRPGGGPFAGAADVGRPGRLFAHAVSLPHLRRAHPTGMVARRTGMDARPAWAGPGSFAVRGTLGGRAGLRQSGGLGLLSAPGGRRDVLRPARQGVATGPAVGLAGAGRAERLSGAHHPLLRRGGGADPGPESGGVVPHRIAHGSRPPTAGRRPIRRGGGRAGAAGPRLARLASTHALPAARLDGHAGRVPGSSGPASGTMARRGEAAARPLRPDFQPRGRPLPGLVLPCGKRILRFALAPLRPDGRRFRADAELPPPARRFRPGRRAGASAGSASDRSDHPPRPGFRPNHASLSLSAARRRRVGVAGRGGRRRAVRTAFRGVAVEGARSAGGGVSSPAGAPGAGNGPARAPPPGTFDAFYRARDEHTADRAEAALYLTYFDQAAERGRPNDAHRGPVEALLLAVRAGRRALAANPDDAGAYLLLGEAYVRLTSQPAEQSRQAALPPLGAERFAQAVAVLEQAVLLRPDLDRAHALLAGLYFDDGQLDRSLDHLRARLRVAEREAAAGGPEAALAVARTPELRVAVDGMEAQVDQALKVYEGNVGDKTDPSKVLDRAGLAARHGLSRMALEMLLESHPAIFGKSGVQLQMDLMIRAGRPFEVRAWLEPSYEAALGFTRYHSLQAQAAAACGDYAAADAELEALSEPVRQVGIAPDRLVPVRIAVALRVGDAVAARSSLLAGPAGLAGTLFTQSEALRPLGSAADLLRQEADIRVLRGLLAVESGAVESAREHFRAALDLWGSDRQAAAGAGLDFPGRPIAQEENAER